MLDYDGNRHSIGMSTRVAVLARVACHHFPCASDLGDPFWRRDSTDQRPQLTNKTRFGHVLQRIREWLGGRGQIVKTTKTPTPTTNADSPRHFDN
jgi:hypothetical protein